MAARAYPRPPRGRPTNINFHDAVRTALEIRDEVLTHYGGAKEAADIIARDPDFGNFDWLKIYREMRKRRLRYDP